jgi:hypothetical protein
LKDEQEGDEIGAANPTVDERIDRGAMSCRVERTDERRRVRPMAASSDSMEFRTLATRPNASPAAQKPTTSRSSGEEYRRTM